MIRPLKLGAMFVTGCIFMAVLWMGLAALSVSQAVGCTSGTRWINYLYETKGSSSEQLLPAYVLVGGSSSHFSFSAERMSEQLGRTVVNFGTHAGLGLQLLLEEARPLLRPDLTVLLALEYEQFAFDPTEFRSTEFEYRACKGLESVQQMPFSLVIRSLAQMSLADILKNFIFNSDHLRRYKVGSVTSYGDETMNRLVDRRETDVVFLRTRPQLAGTIQVSNDARTAITLFVNEAVKKGTTVKVVWPARLNSTIGSDVNFNPLFQLWDEMKVEFVGCPSAGFMPEEAFFDTAYHLNDVGVIANSDRLTAELRRDISVRCDARGRYAR